MAYKKRANLAKAAGLAISPCETKKIERLLTFTPYQGSGNRKVKIYGI